MGTSAIAELTAGFEEPFRVLGRDAARDRDAVVISWPSVPVEIIRAAGLRAVVARGGAEPTPAADAVLEPELFPSRLHQLVEAALTGRLAQVAAIVLPRTSDPDYKCSCICASSCAAASSARGRLCCCSICCSPVAPRCRATTPRARRELLARLAHISQRHPGR